MTRRATLSRDEARRVLAAHVRDLALGVGVPDPVREAELRRIIDGPAAGEIGPQQVVVRGARAPEVRMQDREPGADIEEVVDTRRRVPLWREGEGGELVPLDPHAARVAIAGAILAARGADGAPILYAVSRGIGMVVTRTGRQPSIHVVSDATDLRIAIDEHLSIGVLKATKHGPEEVWNHDHDTVRARLTELARVSAWSAVRVSLPELRTVRNYPYFNPRGKLINVAGYDPLSRCYLTTSTHIQRPEPGETPLTVLGEWLIDFIRRSFGSPHDMTYAMAALLTVLCRDMINGPTPLFAVTAAEHGTGKGKLVDALGLAVTGVTPTTITCSIESDRFAAEIAAALSKGRPMINMDNIRPDRIFGGDAIESITTRTELDTRVFGTNDEMVELLNYAVWFVTANNLQTTADIARRKVDIRLRSKEDGAAKRGGWLREDIDARDGWTVRNRHRILGALVAIIERHLAAKADGWVPGMSVWKPGSYESWASVVGEAVIHAGFPGWGEGIADAAAASDPETAAYRQAAEGIAALHFGRYGNADTERFEVRGAQLAPIVATVEHWADKVERISDRDGPAMFRLSWRLMRIAVGRTWKFDAVEGRMAGTLTFTETRAVGGTVGIFRWRVDE
jgi:hypothetical protein